MLDSQHQISSKSISINRNLYLLTEWQTWIIKLIMNNQQAKQKHAVLKFCSSQSLPQYKSLH